MNLLEQLATLNPQTSSDDDVLDAFLEWTMDKGIELYPAQEEAALELVSGNNVILSTPTGSGKSMVAIAAHFNAMARGAASYYTAPIKALVSEKFFALCEIFGAENVGMITGDSSVNQDAPIICCTAEILANIALREGENADVGVVIMDEFHYYSDPQRGWAWQLPLLELPQSQFLLMSATLGDVSRFETRAHRADQPRHHHRVLRASGPSRCTTTTCRPASTRPSRSCWPPSRSPSTWCTSARPRPSTGPRT